MLVSLLLHNRWWPTAGNAAEAGYACKPAINPNENNKMKKFAEKALKGMDKVVGGDLVIRISGILDGIKGNTDGSIKNEPAVKA